MSAVVGVVGGGDFGRALATAVARRKNRCVVWSRSAREPVDAPGVAVTNDITQLAPCELIFVVVPSMHVPAIAPALGAQLDGRHLLVHVSRGLIGDELQTVSRHLAATTPARRVGCLAGPLNTDVFLRGTPGGGVTGSGFPEVSEAVREAIGGAHLRLYETDDTVGVEVASALVGLLALAAGFCLESRISPSALAVMMSRALAECARVGVKLGAREDTFHGLAGAGDLYAAIAGDERAETRLGRAIARGSDLEQAGREAGAYIEGITIARRVARFADRVGVEAPISSVIADVLEGRYSSEEGLERLLSR